MNKYPRTRHLESSKFQNGDFNMEEVPFSEIKDKYIVVEEKIDGANCGISFVDGELRLQSRGHYLIGGPREKHFDFLKQWSSTHKYMLKELLGERYIMYGEYMYAKHTVFYDKLPHYFFEFDILDLYEDVFLSTKARRKLLDGLPIKSVEVLWEGRPKKLKDITDLVQKSHFKSDKWKENLAIQAGLAGVTSSDAINHTDSSDLMEGLYLKIEDENETIGRVKFVRDDFKNSIIDQDEHWLNRKIIANMLSNEASLW